MSSLNSTKNFKSVYVLDKLQKCLLSLLFLIQFLSLISNIFIVKFLQKIIKPNPIYRNNRPIILMANIAFSGFLLNLNFILTLFMINPFLVDNHLMIASIVNSVMYYLNALSLFVISLSMTLLSCDQYFVFTRVFTNPMDNISDKKDVNLYLVYKSITVRSVLPLQRCLLFRLRRLLNSLLSFR